MPAHYLQPPRRVCSDRPAIWAMTAELGDDWAVQPCVTDRGAAAGLQRIFFLVLCSFTPLHYHSLPEWVPCLPQVLLFCFLQDISSLHPPFCAASTWQPPEQCVAMVTPLPFMCGLLMNVLLLILTHTHALKQSHCHTHILFLWSEWHTRYPDSRISWGDQCVLGRESQRKEKKKRNTCCTILHL